MKNLLYIFAVAIFMSLFTSCESFENVKEKTERVLVQRPHEVWNREAGVNIPTEALGTGQWKHGTGHLFSFSSLPVLLLVINDPL